MSRTKEFIPIFLTKEEISLKSTGEDTKLALSRSRAYKKNGNCFVEQKNSTHVRKSFGYLLFDSVEEQEIINDLYRNELRLFKNFFQPVMKLERKVRVKGKIHRKYDVKVKRLYKVYSKKNGSKIIGIDKKLTASMVSWLNDLTRTACYASFKLDFDKVEKGDTENDY